ncbi:universal stress protein [Methanosarcina sp. KYL-1]|uniref:universal stress protein n=1 Tax=Methanosarcina sp. KYL-1 TaxID=2602068 RepID=UPI00210164D2|nr:universal stress protein [Methanosarcina sp. KYL-1]MCQ1534427.1 universal stress protein [Methanosarcina sp. KYL-1]
MINTVLVPTDFTIETEDLLGCIGELQHVGLKKVILLHVVDILKAHGLTPMFERNAKEKIGEYADFVREMELEAETLVVVGDVKRTIAEVAEREDVDLIVMGTTTPGIIRGKLLGRTTEYIVRKSKKMVLVEKYDALKEGKETYAKTCTATFSRILVPMDCSLEAMRAIRVLSSFAGMTREVLLVHVIENIKDLDFLEEQREEVLQMLRKIGDELKGFDVSHRVIEGIPSDEIARLALKEEVTLIMLTSRGKGIIEELLLGSTAENVLRKTIKPVLLIPSGKGMGGEEKGEEKEEGAGREEKEEGAGREEKEEGAGRGEKEEGAGRGEKNEGKEGGA